MHQQTGAPTFADAFLPEGLGRNETLERIDALLDWEPIARLVAAIHAAPQGRPAYPPLAMFRITLLQQWYDASDPAIEEALRDRLSFRRFAGFGLDDATPDHSTISRFRTQLTRRGLAAPLFAAVGRQLEARGLLVKQGTLLDATLLEAQARRPPSPRARARAAAPTAMRPGRARAARRTSATRRTSGWTPARG